MLAARARAHPLIPPQGGPMTTADRLLSPVNLSDPELFVRNEQHAAFRLLRREAPVSWNPGFEYEGQLVFPGFWNVVKYEDVLMMSRDPATFISSHGIIMGTNPENAGPAAGLGKMMS